MTMPAVVKIVSFGFRNGMPECALVIDCRVLQNPHRNPETRYKTGKDQAVIDDVRSSAHYEKFLNEWYEQVRTRVTQRTGHCVIGVGCYAGRHRSVVVAEELKAMLKERNPWRFEVHHRDRTKKDKA